MNSVAVLDVAAKSAELRTPAASAVSSTGLWHMTRPTVPRTSAADSRAAADS